jgi:preprotein translocase subunit SecG
VIGIVLTVVYVLACFILILFVLLQPGKSDAAAVFGGGVNSAAFGPRGTQTVLAKVTIGAAIVFFMLAFLFSIPGLFAKRSIGEGTPASESSAPLPAPAPMAPPPESTVPATTPPVAPSSEAAAPATEKTDAAKKPATNGTANGNAAKKPPQK